MQLNYRKSRSKVVWKTVKLGLYPSGLAYRTALDERGVLVGSNCRDVLLVHSFPIETKEVDLVRVRVSDLGILVPSTRAVIVQRAKTLGLEVCPAEVGPALRLAYLYEQPNGDSLTIAMKPIPTPIGPNIMFDVSCRQNVSVLDDGYGGDDGLWAVDYELVFVKAKS